MGAAARLPLPGPVSRAAIGLYSRYFGVNLEDVDPGVLADGFGSFDAFFTRPLRRGARAVDTAPTALVSPSDGALREVVPVDEGLRIVAKEHAFSLGELLADDALAETFAGGHLASIYLHPRDYHRVHAPADALVSRVSVVPGRLLPVTDAALERRPELFSRNERMIHVLETVHGVVAVVMVAAFGVGNMSCAYQRLPTHPSAVVEHVCDPPARLRKGDELGTFHLGSTVLVVVQPGLTMVPAPASLPAPIRFGQALFRGEVER